MALTWNNIERERGGGVSCPTRGNLCLSAEGPRASKLIIKTHHKFQSGRHDSPQLRNPALIWGVIWGLSFNVWLPGYSLSVAAGLRGPPAQPVLGDAVVYRMAGGIKASLQEMNGKFSAGSCDRCKCPTQPPPPPPPPPPPHPPQCVSAVSGEPPSQVRSSSESIEQAGRFLSRWRDGSRGAFGCLSSAQRTQRRSIFFFFCWNAAEPDSDFSLSLKGSRSSRSC